MVEFTKILKKVPLQVVLVLQQMKLYFKRKVMTMMWLIRQSAGKLRFTPIDQFFHCGNTKESNTFFDGGFRTTYSQIANGKIVSDRKMARILRRLAKKSVQRKND